MEENTIKVYVKLDANNIVTRIESSISSIEFTNGWIQIDEGKEDKYAHAQGMYLDKGLIDSNGKYNYKLVDNKVVELTDEEKEILFPMPAQESTETEKQAKLINNLILDNLNMQMQIDSLITSSLGGN